MYQIITGGTKEALLRQINGYLFGRVAIPLSGLDLNGLTLIFTSPTSVTVTFADANPVTPAQVVAEINGTAGLAGVASLLNQTTGPRGQVLTLRDPGGTGVTLTGAGTANTLLGFPADNLAAAPVAQTDIVGGVSQNSSGHYSIIINV